ncbi:MAG: hypothetical protein ACOX1M_04590 [Erysipelotrichaceae bacterium]
MESVFEESPSDERINYTLAVISVRKFDNGSSIKYLNEYYRVFDKDGYLKCFKPKTECLVIEAFDGQLLVSIDEQVYSLDKLEIHEKHSEDFDYKSTIKVDKKVYIPPMTHPWRTDNFLKHKKRAHQEHIFT